MKRSSSILLMIILLVNLAPGTGRSTMVNAAMKPANSPAAYVEPGLLSSQAEQSAVIVTAGSSEEAARAVESAGGRVTSQLWLIDAVAAQIPAGRLASLAAAPGVRSVVDNKPTLAAGGKTTRSTPATISPTSATPGWDGWVTDYRFPVPWDGTPDVLPTSSWVSWKLVYPTRIDAGAEQVYWTGSGVTVAVVDSGVFFDEQVKSEMGQYLTKLFIGQADYVDSTCSTYTVRSKTYSTGQQFQDFCFTGVKTSRDTYGHGTHVAGIIWNQLSDYQTGLFMGIAPEARILGVRVLGADGTGTYETVIKGIQYVVANKAQFNVRILNLSLSAQPTTPYFVDPLNRAVEQAWAAGIVVVAAAGNDGPGAETISVPGNDPYVITVGAVDGRRTPGYWKDDILPKWSASGPTLDGFLKPDVLAPGAQIVSFMHNSILPSQRATLVQQHPDYSLTSSLYRMNGTSMATAVTSGVVALMLQAHPEWTPEQVKHRLMHTARQMKSADGQLAMSPLQQGAGRIWALDAVSANIPVGSANQGMDLQADLVHGWGQLDADGNPVLDWAELAHHYVGPVRKALSDDGQVYLYYLQQADGGRVALGMTGALDNQWLLPGQVVENTTWTVGNLVWSGGNLVWSGGNLVWSGLGELFDASGNLVWSGGNLVWSGNGLLDTSGNLVWSGGDLFDASGNLVWSGGNLVWSGGNLVWSGGNLVWSGSEALFDASGNLVWSGGNLVWSGGYLLDASGNLVWSGGDLFDAAGNLVWSGGNLVWSGGNLVWSGGNLVWSGGDLVWSGGNLVWSGGAAFDPSQYTLWADGPSLAWTVGNLVWSGGNLVWSGGNLVWSGGNLVWSGDMDWTLPFDTQSSGLSTTTWVDW